MRFLSKFKKKRQFLTINFYLRNLLHLVFKHLTQPQDVDYKIIKQSVNVVIPS